jgi:hypothetical protein
MPLDSHFGSDCNQSSPRARRRTHGVAAPVFVLVGLALIGMMAIAYRATVVSIAPATGAVYAAAGLPVNRLGVSIAKVHATIAEQTEGPGELLVSGEIENLRDIKTSPPNLRLALLGEDGREIYVWTTKGPKTSLEARERVPFRARLAAPPAGVRDVLVKFAEPGNKGTFTETPS